MPPARAGWFIRIQSAAAGISALRARRRKPRALRMAESFAAWPCGSAKTARRAARRARSKSAGSAIGAEAVGPRGGREVGGGAQGFGAKPEISRPWRAKPLASAPGLSEKRWDLRRPVRRGWQRASPSGSFTRGAGAARISSSRQRRPCSSAPIWRARLRRAPALIRLGARCCTLQSAPVSIRRRPRSSFHAPRGGWARQGCARRTRPLIMAPSLRALPGPPDRELAKACGDEETPVD